MDFHGNINLKQNKMQQLVFQTETGFPASPVVGRVAFKDQRLYMCIALNGAIPVWLPMTNTIDTYIHAQSTAASTWTITHNLNTTAPIVQIYDSNNSMLIPNTVTNIDNNSMSVNLGAAATGNAVVMFGNLIPPSGVGLL